MRKLVSLLSFAVIYGCASLPPVPPPASMPQDIAWSPVTVAVDDPVSLPRQPRPPGKAEKVLPYVEGDWMKLDVPMGEPTVLEFGADEQIIDATFVQPDAETKPWLIAVGKKDSKLPL